MRPTMTTTTTAETAETATTTAATSAHAPVLLSSVLGNSQRLDGGAMFGNAPKALWQKLSPPDAENRIALACRALLVEAGEGERRRRILFETGIGAFFAPPLRERFGVVESEHVLLASLEKLGLAAADITDIVLSHLHFDHAGGLLRPYEAGRAPELCFPNARFIVGAEAFARAQKPHTRDRASFIPELPGLLAASGRLHLVPHGVHEDPGLAELPVRLRFHYSDGHTPGLLLSEITARSGGADAASVVFLGDLVPGTAWVHLPMTMGYDRFPELLIDEKTALLGELAARRSWLFYTHDPAIARSRVRKSPEGRMTPLDSEADFSRQPLA